MCRFCFISALVVAVLPGYCQTLDTNAVAAFSRIVRGWTNYSTAFNATIDTGSAGDYAAVASLFDCPHDSAPAEYAAILISGESGPPDFSDFDFQVGVWSSLEAFIANPRQANLANWQFAAPTGGSTTVPDTRTRGGRPAYELRFRLEPPQIFFTNGSSYWIGFAARADTQRAGELFVPTSASQGSSDVQAGDLVPGWRYVADAGGSTIYSGQLATELLVNLRVDKPRLSVERAQRQIVLSWAVSSESFLLEYATALGPSAIWLPVEVEPYEEGEALRVVLPIGPGRQFFRLTRGSP